MVGAITKLTYESMAELHMFLYKYNGDLTALRNRAIEHITFIPRKKLYRYRSFNERELNTLKNNSIWLSSPSSFPDIFDATIPMQDPYFIDFWYSFYHTFEVAYLALESCLEPGEKIPDKESFLDEIIKIMNNNSPEEIANKARKILGDDMYDSIHNYDAEKVSRVIQSEIEVVTKFLNDLSTSPRRSLAITSFSSKKDNRNMWENYAGSYTGFCVEYDFSSIGEATSEKEMMDVLRLLPIKYYSKRPTFDPRELLRRTVQANLHLSELSFGDDFLQQYYRSITAKGYDYRAENEWRLLMDGTNVGEYYFPYVSSITVGKDMCKENEFKMRRTAEELSVPLLKQTISSDNSTFIYVPCE